MRVFGFSGHSGSGKTTLVTALVPWLTGHGWRVSTIKQANAGFDVDRPGKDSHRHREAGAREVLVASVHRWALMHEYREQPEFGQDELLARMSPVDLVLIEGFRRWSHPRIEVWRAALGKPPIGIDDPLVAAIASPDDVILDGVSGAGVPGSDLPRIDLDDVPSIGRFVLERTGLTPHIR